MIYKPPVMINFHVFKIVFMPLTQVYSRERIRIYSELHKQNVTIVIEKADIVEDAAAYLRVNGFNVVGKAKGNACDYIISDTFKQLTK